jgi:hypothetical protein
MLSVSRHAMNHHLFVSLTLIFSEHFRDVQILCFVVVAGTIVAIFTAWQRWRTGATMLRLQHIVA